MMGIFWGPRPALLAAAMLRGSLFARPFAKKQVFLLGLACGHRCAALGQSLASPIFFTKSSATFQFNHFSGPFFSSTIILSFFSAANK